MKRLVAVALVAIALACRSAVAPSGDAPASCRSDADCATPCGPCDVGAAVTDKDRSAECVVNPCPARHAVCSPQHVCIVQ